MSVNKFPVKLTEAERKILFSILPENKSGYKNYRSIIDDFFIVAEGRFGIGNLILGKEDAVPDLSISSSPIFALGTIITSENNYYTVIHSLDEEMIEIQIDPYPVIDNPDIKSVVSYSDWQPGMKSPENNSDVYEFIINENSYLLAICPSSKKIWLHEYSTQVNFIIPLSNFFNELMRIRKVNDEKAMLNPARFFDEIDQFSHLEIKLAFLMYNKYLKHFNLGISPEELINQNQFQNKKKSFKIFGRGSN